MDRLTTQDDLQAGARWAPALRALGDERLARMVENGSEHAFAAIYGRYAPVLHGYCRSLLRDEEEAGDALQNAMLKALQAMRRAGRSGPLRPWLFRIAHNESVTIIRARGRRPGPLDESLVAGADDAFRRASAREQLAALLEDMQHLTEHQRGALVMRELGGLSYDEIGEALETTPLAARQAVFIARKRLRDGIVHPRRLRPALRQLIPAPGFALLGLFGGGGSAFTAGKALVGTAAAVSVGIGSVELAVDTPTTRHRSTVVAEATATPTPKAHRRAAPAATATAAPVGTSAAVQPTATSAPRVRVQRVAATMTPDPTPSAKTPARHDQPSARHRAPARDRAPERHDDPAPTATTPTATAGPAPAGTTVPVANRPAPATRPGGAGAYAAAGAFARGDRRDCPRGQTPAAATDDTASPSDAGVTEVR